jgi:hypothetical protein
MYRLRSNFDETRLALEARNNALEKLQQSMLEKEQVWNMYKKGIIYCCSN